MLFGLIKPQPVFEAARLQEEGIAGDDIAAFQRLVNRRGRRFQVRVEVTGVYDYATRVAVKSYQQRALAIRNADGYVGPQTARRLRIRLAGPDRTREP